MSPKNFVSAVLLLFVGVCVVVMAARGLGKKEAEEKPPDATAVDPQERPSPPGLLSDGVVVFYFHNNEPCPTCESIQASAKKAVHGDGFAADMKAGRLQWIVLNYEAPEHAHYKQDYGFVTPMVVLVRRSGGKDVASATLDQVWALIAQGKRKECTEYVGSELRAFLDKSAGGAGG
jgi:hypothetical protein